MSIEGLHRILGRTGPTITAVALGCSSMSGLTGAGDNDDVASATIRAAVDQGLDLIDTADFYGLGHNESLIGRALTSIDRDRYVISDKFGSLRTPAGAFIGTDCRPKTVKNSLAYSLQRLGTDHVDIYRPARPPRPDRGHSRRHRRDGPGRLRPRHRTVRGRRRHDPPSPRGAPDQRRADRVLAVQPPTRRHDHSHLP
jgi:aryl-alcohol dehydrogenase-like predicted oxidoreductase